LLVEANAQLGSTAANYVTCLFKDAVGVNAGAWLSSYGNMPFVFSVVAGSLAATTFDLRAGFNGTGNISFNMPNSNTWGGIFTTTLAVTEVAA
jgi:hypothetical protein